MFDPFQQHRERSIRAVPSWVIVLLVISFFMQILWHSQQPPPEAKARDLNSPPALATLRILSAGDPITLSRLIMLWLQSYDNQPGLSLPFSSLNYHRVANWLSVILDLDPQNQYPLLAAAKVYGAVPIPEKQRIMLDFIYDRFLQDPDKRWPWATHAAFIARHRLKDLPLARKFTQALNQHATAEHVPHWAQQMHIFLLEDMGEIESAKILLGGLLESGQITDPNEQAFLYQQLKTMEEKDTSN